MRVVVTGANGFLGAAIAARFVFGGAHVAAVVRPRANLWRLTEIADRVQLLKASGFGEDSLQAALHSFRPDALVHAAWHGVGSDARNDPLQIDANIFPSCRLLHMAAESGCRAFVGIGSQAEYGLVNARCDESMSTKPTTLYGAAKLATCHLCERLADQSSMRFAWLRMFSTYGPRDNPGWLIPYVIRELLSGRRPSLTACDQKWDYLYVDDAADAVRAVTENPCATGVFNVGSGRAAPLRATVELVRDMIDPTLSMGFGEKRYRDDQVMHLEADISRLRVLGWQPHTELSKGLALTVEWFRRNGGAISAHSPTHGL